MDAQPHNIEKTKWVSHTGKHASYVLISFINIGQTSCAILALFVKQVGCSYIINMFLFNLLEAAIEFVYVFTGRCSLLEAVTCICVLYILNHFFARLVKQTYKSGCLVF